jgi:hypothetical protein
MTYSRLISLLIIVCLVWPLAISAQSIMREDEYGVTRIYEGEEYTKLKKKELEKIRKIAEEFAKRLLAKDVEGLCEFCDYDGFSSEKEKKVLELIDEYHDRLGLTLLSIEVRTIRTNEKINQAKVLVLLESSMDEGLEAAPSLEKWKFIYKVNKWLFPLEP